MEIATEIVAEIRARIKATTGLTASGGISYNKVSWQRWHPTRISRTASSSSRRRTVRPSSSNCPSRSSTASGWRLPKDATARDRDGSGPQGENLDFLVEHFGKSGPYFYGIARGIDNRLVKSDRARKSVGAEDTFSQDIHAFEPAREGLQPLIEKVWDYCRANEIGAKTVTLRSNMPTSARSPAAKPFRHLCWRSPIEQVVDLLLAPLSSPRQGIHLLGVSLSSLGRRSFATAPQLRLALWTPSIGLTGEAEWLATQMFLQQAGAGFRPRVPVRRARPCADRGQDGHLAIAKRCDIGIRFDRQVANASGQCMARKSGIGDTAGFSAGAPPKAGMRIARLASEHRNDWCDRKSCRRNMRQPRSAARQFFHHRHAARDA
ncbi:hypothetical protein FHX03_006439 [Rhizobium sp. BK456]|nr:hypothetical protein [Rhizobium sp. BK456]